MYSNQQCQQTVTPTTVLQQLKNIYQYVLQQQKKSLNQLLNLQKIINYIHITNVVRQDPTKNIKQIKQQKKQFNIQRIGQKIQSIIDQTQQITILQNKNDKKPLIPIATTSTGTTIINPITKLAKKQSKKLNQPVIQKKPPIPTANRSNDPNLRSMNPTKYVPPRNKNEVTGKVTQTKILTQQKVFKPQLNSNQKLNQQTVNKQPILSVSIQKRPSTSSSSVVSVNPQPKKQIPNSTSNSISNNSQNHTSQANNNLLNDVDANSISEYKNLRANAKTHKLKQFSKSIEELGEQVKRKKENQRKRYNFKQLIQKYENEEMGHRGLEQKRRKQFIKKLNNYGLSINKSNCNQITNSIVKRVWKQYPFIFEFNNILEGLQEGINKIEEDYKNDLRIDSKEVFRLQYKCRLIQNEIMKIKQSTEIEVPEKLQLTFKPLKLADPNKKKQISNSKEQNRINLQVFYENLVLLLEEIKQSEQLSSKQLALLRMIAQIGIYNGKKSPLIVKGDEFEQWKQSYDQVNDRVSKNNYNQND